MFQLFLVTYTLYAETLYYAYMTYVLYVCSIYCSCRWIDYENIHVALYTNVSSVKYK